MMIIFFFIIILNGNLAKVHDKDDVHGNCRESTSNLLILKSHFIRCMYKKNILL